MKRWGLFLAMLLSVTVLLPGFSSADEITTGRLVQHTIKVETIEVGDVPGHVLGVNQQASLVFYSNGEIATRINTVRFDFVKGKGTATSYAVSTFQDGSTLNTKALNIVTPVDDGKRTAIEGTHECIGGTGRYEGFKGTGTFKGERIGPMKSGGDSYFDFTLNCKKP